MLHPPGYLIRICIEPKAQGKKTNRQNRRQNHKHSPKVSCTRVEWFGARTTILFIPMTSCPLRIRDIWRLAGMDYRQESWRGNNNADIDEDEGGSWRYELDTEIRGVLQVIIYLQDEVVQVVQRLVFCEARSQTTRYFFFWPQERKTNNAR